MSGRRTSPSSRQTKPRRAGATANRAAGIGRKRLAGHEERGLDLAEKARLSLRLAAMRESDHDAVPGAHEACELVLGLGEPTRRDRRALRLERVRLASRERVELGDPVELEDGEGFLLPDAAHLVGLPDEVGGRSTGDEVGRPVGSSSSSGERRPRRDRRDARRPDRRRLLTGWRARCVNGEKARTCSISSPKNSTRSGSRPWTGRRRRCRRARRTDRARRHARRARTPRARAPRQARRCRAPRRRASVTGVGVPRAAAIPRRARAPTRRRARPRQARRARGTARRRGAAVAQAPSRARRRGSGRSATCSPPRYHPLPPRRRGRRRPRGGRTRGRVRAPRAASRAGAAGAGSDTRARGRQRADEGLEAVVALQHVDERGERSRRGVVRRAEAVSKCGPCGRAGICPPRPS